MSNLTEFGGRLMAWIAAGKKVIFNNSLTFNGTDGTTMTFPSTDASIARTDAAQTLNGIQTIKGTTATDGPTYSAEFLGSSGWTSVDWTGSWAAGWTHPVGTIETSSLNAGGSGYTANDVLTVVQAGGSSGTLTVDTVDGSGVVLTYHITTKGSGYQVANGLAVTGGTGTNFLVNILTINNVTALSQSTAAVNATKYQITYTVTGRTAGSFTIAFGGQSLAGLSATGAWGPTTTSTASLVITPTATFDGTIVLSIKSITAASSALAVLQRSIGSNCGEIRGYVTSLFLGYSSGGYTTTGGYNCGISYGALANVTTGNYNICCGYNAGLNITVGNFNSSIGYSSLGNISLGSYNVGLGAYAGRFYGSSSEVTSATYSVFIGDNTKASADGNTKEIVIGSGSVGLGSNSTTIGGSSNTLTELFGNLGLNISTFGTSATKTLALSTGVAPSTSPADAIQIYSADQTAGNACLTTRSEAGHIVKLYSQTLLADLKVDYTTGDLDTEAEVIAAVNSTNTRINNILTILKNNGLMLSA